MRHASPTIDSAAGRPRRSRWAQLILVGVTAALAAQTVPQERSSDGVAWNRMLQLSDGRVFVTDGAITLEASLVNPGEHPSGEPASVSQTVIEGFLAADLPDEFALGELDRGAEPQTYESPSGVTLAARYVDYLRATLPAASLRLRMKGDFEPVVIVSDGKAVGLVMALRRAR